MATRQQWVNGCGLDPAKVSAYRERHPELTPEPCPDESLSLTPLQSTARSNQRTQQKKDHPKPNPPKRSGPGTELKKLIAELGITAKSSCGCNKRAAEMDALGVEGVRATREQWIASILDGYHASSWWDVATAAVTAVRLGLPLTVAGLLDEALRRAESP